MLKTDNVVRTTSYSKIFSVFSLLLLGIFSLNAATIDVKLAPYYAAGNGSSDDTTAIQNAINDNPNSEILLQNGTFKITNTLTLKSGRKLRGESGTLLYSSTSCGTIITCESNVDILDLQINGNNQSTTGIYAGDCKKNIFILNCELFNFAGNSSAAAYAINIRDNCSDISIINTKIHDVDGGGNGVQADTIGANRAILIRGVTRTLVDHCEIYNIGPWEDGDAIQVQATGASDVIIRGCKIYNFMKRAIKIQASGVVITNNFISCEYDEDGVNAPHAGISVLADNCEISNNIIILKLAFTAIDVANCDYVAVTNNYTDIYGYYATTCRTSVTRAMYFYDCNYCTISGNTAFNYYCGMQIRTSYNNTIENNNVLVSSIYPFWFTDGSTTSNNTSTNNIDYDTVLLGFWRFNDSGDIITAFDFADGNYQGNAVGFTSDKIVKGVVGSALTFDGNDDFINMGDVLDMGTSDFSICAWVKSTSTATGAGNGIMFKRGTGNNLAAGYGLNMPNGMFDFHIADGTNYQHLSTGTSGKYNNEEWHHVAAVSDRGADLKIYVDGQLVSSTTETNVGNIDSTTYLTIGGLTLNGTTCYNDFNGAIDEVMIFNKALTVDEVNKIYLKQEIK